MTIKASPSKWLQLGERRMKDLMSSTQERTSHFWQKRRKHRENRQDGGHSAALYPAACSETMVHLVVTVLSPRLTLSHPRNFCFSFKLWSPPVSANQNHTPTALEQVTRVHLVTPVGKNEIRIVLGSLYFLFFQRSLWHRAVDTGMRWRTRYEVTEFSPVFF